MASSSALVGTGAAALLTLTVLVLAEAGTNAMGAIGARPAEEAAERTGAGVAEGRNRALVAACRLAV